MRFFRRKNQDSTANEDRGSTASENRGTTAKLDAGPEDPVERCKRYFVHYERRYRGGGGVDNSDVLLASIKELGALGTEAAITTLEQILDSRSVLLDIHDAAWAALELILGSRAAVEQRRQERRDKRNAAEVVRRVAAVDGARTERERRDALYNVGCSLSRSGRHEEAIRRFLEATAIDPSDAHSYYNIANSYEQLGQKEEAVAFWEKCVENCVGPTTVDQYGLVHGEGFAPDAMNRIAVVLSELGLIDGALQWLDRAIAIAPRYVTAYKNKAAFLYNSGRYQEALGMAEKCMELGDPQGPWLKGLIAKKLG